MFEAVEALIEEHTALEDVLADPSLHADQARARKVNQRYAELSAIVRTYRDWQRLGGDAAAARELAADDADFAAEADQIAARRSEVEEHLRRLLVPRDPTDGKDALLEVKSGEGGEESALFAGDLLRMYTRYAEQRGWTTEVLDATESDLGGYKSVTVAVKAKGTPAAEVCTRPWLSVTGTRCTRCTPPSNFSRAYGASPGSGLPLALTATVTDL